MQNARIQVQARLFVTSDMRRLAATPPSGARKVPIMGKQPAWQNQIACARPAKTSAIKTRRRARIAARLKVHFTESMKASRDAAGKSTHRKEETCRDMPLLAHLQLKILSPTSRQPLRPFSASCGLAA